MKADFIIEIAVLAFVAYLAGAALVGPQGLFLRFQSQNELAIYLKRIWGFVCLLGVPLAFASDYILQCPIDVGLSVANLAFSLLVWFCCGLLVLPISFYRAKNPNNLAQYPQIRFRPWNPRITVLNSLSWFLYLIAYEFLFRGWLFFGCLEQFGSFGAIAINVILYSLAHIHKGRLETVGSIPLGIVFCGLALWTGSVWTPLLVHCTISISTEWFSARNAGLLSIRLNYQH